MSAERASPHEQLRWPSCVDGVVSPYCGLVSSVTALEQPFGYPKLKVYSASLGDLGRLSVGRRRSYHAMRPSATGRALDDRLARSIAISEAIERYSSCMFSTHGIVTASAAELGAAAMDLGRIPRSSDRELEDTRCPVLRADPHAPIRWVESIELISGRRMWVPAVMVFIRIPALPSERFWLQISTGCAAHTDMRMALVGALCEVIERDAVALTWLQRLPLSSLNPKVIPAAAQHMLGWCERNNVKIHLFDATTDLGVPTIYTITLAPADPRAAQMVGCSTSVTVEEAVNKAVTETCVTRAAVRGAAEPPEDVAKFCDVLHGAVYLGRPENRHAFNFLLDDIDSRAQTYPADLVDETEDALDALRLMLKRRQIEAYAINLTTREAAAVGLSVVRVIVPALQPVSFTPLAQYRGHPRLFAGPALMGHRVHAEIDLNPWPQPFP